MISFILNGRNDSQGYNLHKRAAISLNCLAEILRNPDDEIVFVDYNTPNDLPTLVEAIYDTLTDAARSRLRVFRVRPNVHAGLLDRLGDSSASHYRNLAIRQSNPRNRWVMTVPNGMVLVPRCEMRELHQTLREMANGEHVFPCMNVPTPLWDSLPRSNPTAVMHACRKFGSRFLPEENFRTGCSGYLMPRQALFDLHGFDERLADNSVQDLSRRLRAFHGVRNQSLAHCLEAYQFGDYRLPACDSDGDERPDPALRKDPVAWHQAENWGISSEPLEEVGFRNGPAARFVPAVKQTLGAPQQGEYHSDSNDLRNFVFYHQKHALPFVMGQLTVYPRGARIAYVGNNLPTLELTTRSVAEIGFLHPLQYVAELLSTGPAPVGAAPVPDTAPDTSLESCLVANFDVLIFDFGLDSSCLEPGPVNRVTDWPRDARHTLGRVARSLELCAGFCDRPSRERAAFPDFLVINANHHVFRGFIDQFLISTDTPYPTHVRKGRPRIADERLFRSSAWKNTVDTMRSFFAYGEEDLSAITIGPGDAIDLTAAGRSARFKDGNWGAMDYTGTWIDGLCASLEFAPRPGFRDDLVAYVCINEAFLGPEGAPMVLQVYCEGEWLARWTIYSASNRTLCNVVVPGHLLTGKPVCRLEFRPVKPQSVDACFRAQGRQLIGEDPRQLSVRLQSIEFSGADRMRYDVGRLLDFTDQGTGVFHTDERWTPPDNLGMWSIGPEAGFTLLLGAALSTPVYATFRTTDAAVSEQLPHLHVVVSINGRSLVRWTLGPKRGEEERRMLLPAGLPGDPNRLNVSFHIEDPRQPAQLGWGGGPVLPLGFRLTGLRTTVLASAKYKLGELIDFTHTGNSILVVGEELEKQWTLPATFGSWTIGEQARIQITWEEPPPARDLPMAVALSECVVGAGQPDLPVAIEVNGRRVGEWKLLPGRLTQVRSLVIPADVVASSPHLELKFRMSAVGSPAMCVAGIAIGRSTIDMPGLGGPVRVRRPMIRRILGLPHFALHVARILAKRYLG